MQQAEGRQLLRLVLLRLGLAEPPEGLSFESGLALARAAAAGGPPLWFQLDVGVEAPSSAAALRDKALLAEGARLELSELQALMARALLGRTAASVVATLERAADLPLPCDVLDVLHLNEAPRPQLRTLQLVLLGGGPWAIRLLEGAIAVGGFALAFNELDATKITDAVVEQTMAGEYFSVDGDGRLIVIVPDMYAPQASP